MDTNDLYVKSVAASSAAWGGDSARLEDRDVWLDFTLARGMTETEAKICDAVLWKTHKIAPSRVEIIGSHIISISIKGSAHDALGELVTQLDESLKMVASDAAEIDQRNDEVRQQLTARIVDANDQIHHQHPQPGLRVVHRPQADPADGGVGSPALPPPATLLGSASRGAHGSGGFGSEAAAAVVIRATVIERSCPAPSGSTPAPTVLDVPCSAGITLRIFAGVSAMRSAGC